jgi:membrane associated rhomboid family serine protease
VQAAVGSHCVDCRKAAQPDLKTRVRYANARQPALITSALIAINVAIFAWITAKDTGTLGGSGQVSQQQDLLGLNRGELKATHEWYRLITSGFIHFGVIHIAFNMYILYQLGQLLERTLGRTQFTLLYFASLLGGSAGVLLLTTNTGHTLSGGASGAVFGLMAALTISMYRQGINIFQTGVGRLLMLNLVFTFIIPGIAIGGHLGGLAAGALCGTVMLAPKWKPVPAWARYAAPIAVSVLAVVISVVVVG